MSYVMAIANEKGGVAKTTTALSLGAAMAEMGKSILLVDLDPQSNLTLALGKSPASQNQTVSDLLLGDSTLAATVVDTDVEGVWLVPANSGLLSSERFLSVRENYERILGERLKEDGRFAFVILDCPPAMGVTTRSALMAANLILIPTQAEFFSANALRDVLQLIREIRQRGNPHLRYKVLITMLDRRNRIHRTLFEQVRRTFGQAVLETVIEIDTRLRESPIFGKPITAYAPKSRGAEQYRDLAKELMAYAT
jgi:chromosome partitioning protein